MVTLIINNTNADLYEDETIEVNSKIKDAKELGKIFTDYSTSFTLPATRINNKIFRHFHNEGVVVETDFRLSQDAIIELDTIPFKEGQVRLENVKMKNNAPHNYTVKFYGNGVNIKRAVGDALLSDLVLADYDHTRNATVVRNGLAAGENWNGIDDNIIYPLVTKSETDWNTTSLGDGTSIDHTSFYPAIKVARVIDEIARQYSLEFDSDYWTSTAFERLYLWCPIENHNEGSATDGDTKVLLTFASSQGSDIGVNIGESQIESWKWGTLTRQVWYLGMTVSDNTPYKFYIERKVGGSWIQVKEYIKSSGGSLSETYDIGYSVDTYRFRVEPDTAIDVWFQVYGEVTDERTGGSPEIFYVYGTGGQTLSDADAQLRYKVPKMKITEFLDGILQLSNSVMIPKGNNSFIVEPYDDWKAAGKVVDLTKYFEIGSATINAVPLPSEINMLYKAPKAANNKFFADYNGYAYGDRVNQATGGEGSPYEIKLPFENLLFDKQSDSNLLIGKSVEATEKSTELKPIQDSAYLFYYAGDQSGVDIDISDFSSPVTNYKVVNTFYPLGTPTDSLNFGEEINPMDGIRTQGVGIYFAHYVKLMNSIFNPQYRLYKMEAILPASILNSVAIDALEVGETESEQSININDVIQIRDRYFNIEDMTVELSSKKARFTLSNVVIDDATFDDGVDREPPTAPVLDYVPNPDLDAPVIGVLSWDDENSVSVDLSWTAATDASGSVVNYKIYMDGALEKTVGNVLSTTVTGLSGNTAYSFWITAVDDSGNESAVSNTVSGSTNSTLPLPVISSPLAVTWSDMSQSYYTVTATNTPNKFKATGLQFFMSFDTSTGVLTDNNYPNGANDDPFYVGISASNDGGVTYGTEETLTINY